MCSLRLERTERKNYLGVWLCCSEVRAPGSVSRNPISLNTSLWIWIGLVIGHRIQIPITGIASILLTRRRLIHGKERATILFPNTWTRLTTSIPQLSHGRSVQLIFKRRQPCLTSYLSSSQYAVGSSSIATAGKGLKIWFQFGDSQVVQRAKLPQIVQAVIRYFFNMGLWTRCTDSAQHLQQFR